MTAPLPDNHNPRGQRLDGLLQAGDYAVAFGKVTSPTLRERLNDGAQAAASSVADRAGALWQRPGSRRGTKVCLAVLLLASAAALFWAVLPRSAPDYLNDDLEDVLDYTLLTEDFNKLALADRLRLMKQLIERFKGMDGGDSALLAAFAAGLSRTALEQARLNMERLAVDLWDDYSSRYRNIPVKDRQAFLDDSFLEFSKLMEETAGISRERSDSDRLADAKKQAARDTERAPEPGAMTPERVAPLLKMMQDRGQQVSSPEQRGRMAKFSRDMVRHLRGQDVDSGAPKSGGPVTPPPPPAPPGPDGDKKDKKDKKEPGEGQPSQPGQPPAPGSPEDEAAKKEQERIEREWAERDRLEKEAKLEKEAAKAKAEKEAKAKADAEKEAKSKADAEKDGTKPATEPTKPTEPK